MKKIGIVFALLALIGLTVLNWTLPSQAAVTTNVITVTTLSDNMSNDGACSLREAMHNVNTESAFSPALGECAAGSATLPNVIVLQSGLTYNLTAGTLEILNDVRLETTADSMAGIATTDNQRVIYIDGVTVAMYQLLIEDGFAPIGAGIYNNGGSLTLTDSVVQNNTATELGGGLVNSEGATAVVNNSTFFNNTGSMRGGGIYNAGLLTINNDSLIQANNSFTEGGGGLYNNGGTVTINDSTLSLNEADAENASGGGIYNNNGLLTLHNVTLAENKVGEYGGGIYHSNGQLTIRNSQLQSNEASLGGGLSIRHSNAQGETTVSIESSLIKQNKAATAAGGLHLLSIDTNAEMLSLQIAYSTFEGNEAQLLAGGGIGLVAMSADNNLATILNSTIIGNKAPAGGGVVLNTPNNGSCSDAPALRLINSTVTGNSALSHEGGGIEVWGGSLDILHTTITKNDAILAGGGIHSRNDSSTCVRVGHSIIASNDGVVIDDVAAENTDQRFVSLGHNVIGTAGPNVDFSLEFNLPSDQTSVNNAGLAPLADNGGETQTHALQEGSPAIGVGDPAVCAAPLANGVDQRGFPRPSFTCDSGSFQTQPNFLYLPIITR